MRGDMPILIEKNSQIIFSAKAKFSYLSSQGYDRV